MFRINNISYNEPMRALGNQYVKPLPYGFATARYLLKRKGLAAALQYIAVDMVWRWCQIILTLLARSMNVTTFSLDNRHFRYNLSRYNWSLSNERAVEIAVAEELLQQISHKRLLEVGCVLPHYTGKADWTVLDKFEPGVGIINQDIFTYAPSRHYDGIISVSTIEHIGIDDTVKNRNLSVQAIELMKQWLNPGGKLLVTFPVGYNRLLDRVMLKPDNGLTASFGMVRTSPANTWKQVHFKNLVKCKYSWPYNNANGLFIGIYKKNR